MATNTHINAIGFKLIKKLKPIKTLKTTTPWILIKK